MSDSTDRKLVSQLLSQDADLRDIVEEFVGSLPQRLDELKQAYQALDWGQLAGLAHRLKGASGSYGYPQLSELAARMESAFRQQQAEDFPNWANEFQDLVAAAARGLVQEA